MMREKVVANAKALCEGLQSKGYKISTGGTDVHLILVDLRPHKISGAKAERILEEISIAFPGDKSAMNPSGIRLGTPALTTRGLKEVDIQTVVDFIDKGLQLSKEVTKISGPMLVDFKKVLSQNEDIVAKVNALKAEVEQFAQSFPLPGLSTL